MLEKGLIICLGLQLIDLTKCPKCMLFMLRDQQRLIKSIFLRMSKALHRKPNENCTAHRKYGVTSAVHCSE